MSYQAIKQADAKDDQAPAVNDVPQAPMNWQSGYSIQPIPGMEIFWRIQAEHRGGLVFWPAVHDTEAMQDLMTTLPHEYPNHYDWKAVRYEPVFAMYEGVITS